MIKLLIVFKIETNDLRVTQSVTIDGVTEYGTSHIDGRNYVFYYKKYGRTSYVTPENVVFFGDYDRNLTNI